MTRREKIGVGVLIGLMSLLLGALTWTLWGKHKGWHAPAESVFVKQRLINLDKSK
jgi:hypothetical protein